MDELKEVREKRRKKSPVGHELALISFTLPSHFAHIEHFYRWGEGEREKSTPMRHQLIQCCATNMQEKKDTYSTPTIIMR